MKRFEAIILSEVEPGHSCLWLRPPRENKGAMSLWWFSPQGWKKLFDLDTRYTTNVDFSVTPAESFMDSESTYDNFSGIVTTDTTYNVYDGSREIGDNGNLVVEKGLKYHVDNLQEQIDDMNDKLDDLSERVESNKQDIKDLQGTIETLQDGISTVIDSIENLDTRVSALENTEQT